MLTFDQLWGRLCELDETVQIEAKSGQQLGRSLLETISSFSNEPGRGGGYLLLGVRPVGGLRLPAYEIVGVSDPDRMQADLASQCRTLFNRPVRPVIQVESRDGKPVVIAWIPEAARHDKPIYIESRGLPRVHIAGSARLTTGALMTTSRSCTRLAATNRWTSRCFPTLM